MFSKVYEFGESKVYYLECQIEGHEGKTTVGLAVYPRDIEIDTKKLYVDSLVQVAFTGDENLVDYTLGVTMRNKSSTCLSVKEQTSDEKGVYTRLADGKGNEYLHTLLYDPKTGVFTSFVRYENRTGKAVTLEMLQSFSLSGISSPSRTEISTCGLTLHRMTAAWSRECRLKSDSFPSLGLDMSWARYGVKCEKWGQIGSMPVRGYYPFAAIEDEGGVIWGAQIETPYSWQMEVYEEKETCSLSGGLADYEYGHFQKRIEHGGSFESHRAYFVVKNGGGVEGVCNALRKEQDLRLSVPKSEENMPILFNEYCTTWGCPSEENVGGILDALEGLPIKIFVVDCGWYKPDDKGWCNAIGDWNESKTLFPEGISHLAKRIRGRGMIPGIWFEYEVAGRDSDCFHNKDLLLTRDHELITAKNRRFLDLRKPVTKQYFREKTVNFLKENGFSYIKIDYNDNIGLGCDGCESLGEGGRQVQEESLKTLDELKQAIPEIIIENCSSGGSRIEPLRMSKVSMCSFSDAHECEEIPLVAANVSRLVPARQEQIWAVLRKGESDSRTIYSLTAAMMGRICLSGDIVGISKEKKELILRGLNFYEKVKDIVAGGDILCIDSSVRSYREQFGRQVYIKEFGSRRLVLVHQLKNKEEIFVPAEGYRLEEAYTDMTYTFDEGIKIQGGSYTAGAFLLARTD